MEQILTKDALYRLSYISAGNVEYFTTFPAFLQGLCANFLIFFLQRTRSRARPSLRYISSG